MVRFSVVVNGETMGFFTSSRGLRQGDSISPLLFILMANSLSRKIDKSVIDGLLKGSKPTSTNQTASHQQFADDTILLLMASILEAKATNSIMKLYESAFGKEINFDKISIFFFNTPGERHLRIAKILGCKINSLPTTYLGLPFGTKKLSANI